MSDLTGRLVAMTSFHWQLFGSGAGRHYNGDLPRGWWQGVDRVARRRGGRRGEGERRLLADLRCRQYFDRLVLELGQRCHRDCRQRLEEEVSLSELAPQSGQLQGLALGLDSLGNRSKPEV